MKICIMCFKQILEWSGWFRNKYGTPFLCSFRAIITLNIRNIIQFPVSYGRYNPDSPGTEPGRISLDAAPIEAVDYEFRNDTAIFMNPPVLIPIIHLSRCYVI
jgi:hypothetical protein